MHLKSWHNWTTAVDTLRPRENGRHFALVRVIACRRPGDKPLPEPMIATLLRHICVTRPQRVKLCGYWRQNIQQKAAAELDRFSYKQHIDRCPGIHRNFTVHRFNGLAKAKSLCCSIGVTNSTVFTWPGPFIFSVMRVCIWSSFSQHWPHGYFYIFHNAPNTSIKSKHKSWHSILHWT